MNNHIKTLVYNTVEKALENLSKTGVGYIECEDSDSINYRIDDKVFCIEIKFNTDSVDAIDGTEPIFAPIIEPNSVIKSNNINIKKKGEL